MLLTLTPTPAPPTQTIGDGNNMHMPLQAHSNRALVFDHAVDPASPALATPPAAADRDLTGGTPISDTDEDNTKGETDKSTDKKATLQAHRGRPGSSKQATQALSDPLLASAAHAINAISETCAARPSSHPQADRHTILASRAHPFASPVGSAFSVDVDDGGDDDGETDRRATHTRSHTHLVDGADDGADLTDDGDFDFDLDVGDDSILLRAGILPECESDYELAPPASSSLPLSPADELAGELADERKYTRFLDWMRTHGATFPNLELKRYAKDYRGVHIHCQPNQHTTTTQRQSQLHHAHTPHARCEEEKFISSTQLPLPSLPTEHAPHTDAPTGESHPSIVGKGATLLAIPHHLLITVELAKSTPLGSAIQHLPNLGSQAILAVYLIQENFKQRCWERHQEERRATNKPTQQHGCEEEKHPSMPLQASPLPPSPSRASSPIPTPVESPLSPSPASAPPPAPSFWHPWLSVLPSAFHTLPMFFSDREIDMLGGCNELLIKVASQKKSMREEFNAIKGLLKKIYIRQVRSGCVSTCIPLPQFGLFLRDFTYRTFVWGCLAVGTRVFSLQINNVKTSVLAPLADMMNHKYESEIDQATGHARGSGTNWTYDSKRHAFTLTSCIDLPHGAPVYESYGIKDNKRFFASYGFCLTDNHANEVALFLPADDFPLPSGVSSPDPSSHPHLLYPPPHAPSRSFILHGVYDHLAEDLLNFLRLANCYEEQVDAEEEEAEIAEQMRMQQIQQAIQIEQQQHRDRHDGGEDENVGDGADVDDEGDDGDVGDDVDGVDPADDPAGTPPLTEADLHAMLQHRIMYSSQSSALPLGHSAGVSAPRFTSHDAPPVSVSVASHSAAAAAAAAALHRANFLRSASSPFVPSGPISLENELSALYSLRQCARLGLRVYDTSLESDELLLNALPEISSSIAMVNQRNAIIFRMGEKKILHYWIDFATLAITLLCAPWDRIDSEGGEEEEEEGESCKSKIRRLLESGTIDGILAPYESALTPSNQQSTASSSRNSPLPPAPMTIEEYKREGDSCARVDSNGSSVTGSGGVGACVSSRPSTRVRSRLDSAPLDEDAFSQSLSCPSSQALILQDIATPMRDGANTGIAAYITNVIGPIQQQRHRMIMKRNRKNQLQLMHMQQRQHHASYTDCDGDVGYPYGYAGQRLVSFDAYGVDDGDDGVDGDLVGVSDDDLDDYPDAAAGFYHRHHIHAHMQTAAHAYELDHHSHSDLLGRRDMQKGEHHHDDDDDDDDDDAAGDDGGDVVDDRYVPLGVDVATSDDHLSRRARALHRAHFAHATELYYHQHQHHVAVGADAEEEEDEEEDADGQPDDGPSSDGGEPHAAGSVGSSTVAASAAVDALVTHLPRQSSIGVGVTSRPASSRVGIRPASQHRARSDSALSSRSISRSASRAALLTHAYDHLRSAGGGGTSRASRGTSRASGRSTSHAEHEDSIMRESDEADSNDDTDEDEEHAKHTPIIDHFPPKQATNTRNVDTPKTKEKTNPTHAAATPTTVTITNKKPNSIAHQPAQSQSQPQPQRPPPITVYHDASSSGRAGVSVGVNSHIVIASTGGSGSVSGSRIAHRPAATQHSSSYHPPPSTAAKGQGQPASAQRKKILSASTPTVTVTMRPSPRANPLTPTNAEPLPPLSPSQPIAGARTAASHVRHGSGSGSHMASSPSSSASHSGTLHTASNGFSSTAPQHHSVTSNNHHGSGHPHARVLHPHSSGVGRGVSHLTPSPPPFSPSHSGSSSRLPSVSPQSSPSRLRVAPTSPALSASAAISPSKVARLPIIHSPMAASPPPAKRANAHSRTNTSTAANAKRTTRDAHKSHPYDDTLVLHRRVAASKGASSSSSSLSLSRKSNGPTVPATLSHAMMIEHTTAYGAAAAAATATSPSRYPRPPMAIGNAPCYTPTTKTTEPR